MKRVRHILYLWHRYVGLAMALFLTIAALTGSLLAFREQIERFVAPQLYGKPMPGVRPMNVVALAQRVQEQLPNATVTNVVITYPDQATIAFTPKSNPATGKPYNLGFRVLYVDPRTGAMLAHRTDRNDISEGLINLMPWILQIHDKLLNRGWGTAFVGFVALFWLIDCFVALYLTLPPVLRNFLQNWKSSWQIKTTAGPYRLNLDLHRAFGLWLWPALFVFAYSSVIFNLRFEVYEPVAKVFNPAFRSIATENRELIASRKTVRPPKTIDWNRAYAECQRLLAPKAAEAGATLGELRQLGFIPVFKAYTCSARFGNDERGGTLTFDPETSAIVSYGGPEQFQRGRFIEYWVLRLHTAQTLGPLYQTFVAFLGLVIAMFSVTGIYLWWKKRAVRVRKRDAVTTQTSPQMNAAISAAAGPGVTHLESHTWGKHLE